MNLEYVLPKDIEKRSFEIIESELEAEVPEEIKPVVIRAIHTTADFDYAKNLYFSKNIVDKALEVLDSGAVIVTDTNMAKAGINKAALSRHGCECMCFMADADVAETAKQNGTTRATASVDKAAALGRPVIYAVGNAPTALVRLCEHISAGDFIPKFVIGAPVGFVNVVQSKELLIASGIPCIVARGRKGGSNVAAAICNALLYMLDEQKGYKK
ncbi:precorrin-8X methylmutase [Ruminococcus sp. YRD2003]|uniref:precorrin-8X methylmutase n=1 Tax=Ruminococcus sp. YRD2003 TaxID=1452313 RepID=UPI0008BB7405|nr:precorrin-8X methylmutase [Ruminococcus flavefaciens]